MGKKPLQAGQVPFAAFARDLKHEIPMKNSAISQRRMRIPAWLQTVLLAALGFTGWPPFEAGATQRIGFAAVCDNNLKVLASAREQWELEHKGATNLPPIGALVGRDGYLRALPECPRGGRYSWGPRAGRLVWCSFHGGEGEGSAVEQRITRSGARKGGWLTLLICMACATLISPVSRLTEQGRARLAFALAGFIVLLLAVVFLLIPMVLRGWLPPEAEVVRPSVIVLCVFGIGFGGYALTRKVCPLAALILTALLGLALIASNLS